MANADPLRDGNHRTNAVLGKQSLARSILARHRVFRGISDIARI
jgi:hypothetical protein